MHIGYDGSTSKSKFDVGSLYYVVNRPRMALVDFLIDQFRKVVLHISTGSPTIISRVLKVGKSCLCEFYLFTTIMAGIFTFD